MREQAHAAKAQQEDAARYVLPRASGGYFHGHWIGKNICRGNLTGGRQANRTTPHHPSRTAGDPHHPAVRNTSGGICSEGHLSSPWAVR
ncbi:hypothetical protein [Sulfitobacter undariae]|uniref:hypothetical protein n=1 Tax=Sulfitobacter undariae TaxID=1563671 RepID=UPI001619F009|nr:hypothetical protein [Sulfitobacter undariae]